MSALTSLAKAEGRRGGFCVLVDAPADDDVVLPRETELACYRVAGEAFTNIVTHAHAGHVALSVTRTPGGVDIRVVDDGRGFDVKPVVRQAALSGQLGLLGMNERLSQIGGVLTIQSKRGGGTSVVCRVPMPPDVERAGEDAA
jgi:two-component system sensor histidine kinase UhpB